MAPQDLDCVGAFVRDFVSRTLLPKLEERVARLNASITATRRGLRNRLNRFWKGAAEDRQTDRCVPCGTRKHAAPCPMPCHASRYYFDRSGVLLSFVTGDHG